MLNQPKKYILRYQ